MINLREKRKEVKKRKNKYKNNWIFYCWACFLLIGANYVVDSVINISTILGVPISVISITAIAVGTSLSELVVSAKAAIDKKIRFKCRKYFFV